MRDQSMRDRTTITLTFARGGNMGMWRVQFQGLGIFRTNHIDGSASLHGIRTGAVHALTHYA